MDKPVSEWKKKLRGMCAKATEDAWRAKAGSDVSWKQEINFHVACAERMRQLGNMAIDIDEKLRKALCIQANEILARVEDELMSDGERLSEIEEMIQQSDAYYETYGTRTARYYMYEQGLIDVLGDRLDGRSVPY